MDNTIFKKWSGNWTITLQEKISKWPVSIGKGGQNQKSSAKCKITLWDTTTQPSDWLKLKNLKIPTIGESMEHLYHFLISVDSHESWCNNFEKTDISTNAEHTYNPFLIKMDVYVHQKIHKRIFMHRYLN